MIGDVAPLLERYRRQVPVQVEALARNLGIRVRMNANLELGISGHITRTAAGEYEIATAAGEPLTRQRFTLAHEIGHFLLHRSILDRSSGINDSTMYRTDTAGVGFNMEISEIHERQANSFAANLLMPKERIQERFAGGQRPSLASLASEFEVSQPAMQWRLTNLGLGAGD
jgi:IrrE N-terminal-like domain